jgi:hypothetical protein
MPLNSYSTGTVTIGAGATTIVGAGCIWSSPNARPGDIFYCNGYSTTIEDVVDNTHLVIEAWPFGAIAAGSAYKILQISPLRFAGGQAMADVSALVAALNTNGFYVFVPSTATVPDPSYGEDGQYAFQASTGKLWVKDSGAWNFLGVYKGFNIRGAYDNAASYAANDVVYSAGSSYIAIASTTGNAPPNVTYWALLASVGNTGPLSLNPVAAWVTAHSYVAGPPADYVTINGSSYMCLVAHMSGVFATDLAAGKWGLVAQKGVDGTNAPTYGGTSTTSIAIGTGSKVFTTQAGLAYQNGARVRASSGVNWLEGVVIYSGTTLTITADKTNGSGTFTSWTFNVVGQPGAGDLSSANNLLDVANVNTALINLGGVSYNTDQGATAAQKAQARANIGVLKRNYIINGAMMVNQEIGLAAVSAAGAFPVDQWQMATFSPTTATFSAAQIASVSPAGSPNRLRVTATASQNTVGSSLIYIQQAIEGKRVADLQWGTAAAKTVTLSIGMKPPISGTYVVQLNNSGGSSTAVGTITIASGEVGTDVIKLVTLAGITTGTWLKDNGIGMVVQLFLMHSSQTANVFSTSSTGTFELFDVDLYEGSASRSFTVPDFHEELRQCQRYYEKSFDYATPPGTATPNGADSIFFSNSGATSNGGGMSPRFKVPKRATPTIVTYSETTGAAGKIRDRTNAVDVTPTVDLIGENGARVFAAVTTNTGCALSCHWTSSARM